MNDRYHRDGLAVNLRRGRRAAEVVNSEDRGTSWDGGAGGPHSRTGKGEHDVLDKANPAPDAAAPPRLNTASTPRKIPAGFDLASGSPLTGREGGSPSPSFYAVIPASVRYCKGLSSSAKLLYGEVTALCQREGYCWASTEYFAALYEVDRSTVKKWLASLSLHGFIAVQVNYDWPEQRRIYLADAVPKQLGGVAQKRATGGAKTSHGWRKNAPPSITEINTESITTTLNVVPQPLRFVEPGPVPAAMLEGREGAAARRVDKVKEQSVREVVGLTDDSKSIRRFDQLWGICEQSDCADVWTFAVEATKTALGATHSRVRAPGAYFCGLVVSALMQRGIPVPVGNRSERSKVRSIIAQSLASVEGGCK